MIVKCEDPDSPDTRPLRSPPNKEWSSANVAARLHTVHVQRWGLLGTKGGLGGRQVAVGRNGFHDRFQNEERRRVHQGSCPQHRQRHSGVWRAVCRIVA